MLTHTYSYRFLKMVLSRELKLLLASEVAKQKHILFGKLSPMVTRTKRNGIWEEIRQKLLDRGANIPNAELLRDQDWGNLRRTVVARYTKSKKSGEGGGNLTDLDIAVLDIIGRESSSLNALNIPDVKPSFAELSNEGDVTQINLEEVEFIIQDDNGFSNLGTFYNLFLNLIAFYSVIGSMAPNLFVATHGSTFHSSGEIL